MMCGADAQTLTIQSTRREDQPVEKDHCWPTVVEELV